MSGRSSLPEGACDTHIHFYNNNFPGAPKALLHPPDASPDDYRALQAELGTERLVVVQPTTYGLDNTCQLQAMAEFGDSARGVMVVDDKTSTDDLKMMTRAGVRGARFHMLPGGAVPWDLLEVVAGRVSDFGWHIQLQLNGRELHQHQDRLLNLGVDLVVDHVGRFMPPVDLDDRSFEALLCLLDNGHTWVKLSAPYESSVTGPPDYSDVALLASALLDRFPSRMLWATNWPHPGQADPPSSEDLATMLRRWLPDEELRRQVLVHNPGDFYGF